MNTPNNKLEPSLVRGIDMRTFSLCFVVYALCSLVVFVWASYTEAAWMVYALLLLPFLLLCLAYCLFLAFKFPTRAVLLNHFWLVVGLIVQVSVLLTSPADCRGWHQGAACYSFLQTHLSNTAAQGQVHWGWFEFAFPVLLALYAVCVVVFLKNLTARWSAH